MRRRRKPDGRDGGRGAGRLPLRSMLAGVHRDPIRAALFGRGDGTHAGGVFGRDTRRQARLGVVLSAHDGCDDTGAGAAGLDRQAQRRALRESVAAVHVDERLTVFSRPGLCGRDYDGIYVSAEVVKNEG